MPLSGATLAAANLRAVLLSGYFFLGAVIATIVTKVAALRLSEVPPLKVLVNKISADVSVSILIRLGPSSGLPHPVDYDSYDRITVRIRILSSPHDVMRTVWLQYCRERFVTMIKEKQDRETEESKAKAQVSNTQPDDLVDFHHLKSRKGLSQPELEDEGQNDLKLGTGEFSKDSNNTRNLKRLLQLPGFSYRSSMSGLQQQQQHAKVVVEPARSGSSSGWGTCAELLLVSAVKKHGVPNWNLVALELKARAILLNIPPSCFSDEACRFKYNVLKGKFASSSSSGMSSLDDDLTGAVSWFEELRKSRMSHLKEELQVCDSSIGKLQSRINKLKEEREQCLSLQSVIKQCDTSRCEVDTDPVCYNTPDLKAPIIPPSRSEEPTLGKTQDMVPKDFVQPDLRAGELATGGLDRRLSCEMASEGLLDRRLSCEMASEGLHFHKDAAVTSTTKLLNQNPTDEVEVVAHLTAKQSPPPAELDRPGEKVPEKDERVGTGGENDAIQVGEAEIVKQEADGERGATVASDQARITRGPSGTSCSTGAEDIVTPRDALGDSENHDIVGMHNNRAQGQPSDADVIGTVVCTLPRTNSTTTEVDFPPQELPGREPPREALLSVTFEGGPDLRETPEAEASTCRGKEVESGPTRRESRLSKLSLRYGRAEKEKRLKAKEESKRRRQSRPEVREIVEDQLSQRTTTTTTLEASELSCLHEGTMDVKEASVLLEQIEEGRKLSPRDPTPLGEADAGSTKRYGSDLPSERCFGDDADVREPIDTHHPPSDMDVLPASSGLVSRKTAEPSSPGVDLPPLAGMLSVTLGPDPDHVEPPAVSPKLENSPSSQREQSPISVKHGALETETTVNEVKSSCCLSDRVSADVVDLKSEEPLQAADDVESDILKAGHDEEEGKIEEIVDMVGKQEVVERLDTDLGTPGSLDDDVPETLGRTGSENVQEESRDGHELGECRPPFPDYTDSQVDKSEVGSSMDSIEDMSPSSRKNRREPKVPGKLLPLLECLRVICAHKFAPLFRQRQEYQDNAQYDRLVRRHVDLSMVRARLEDGAYSGSVEFFRDLLLIFTNALVYNSTDSQEYAGAKVLRSCALSEMHKILQTEALLKQNGPATRKREVKKSMEVHKTRISSTSGSEGRKKGILKGSNESAAASQDLQVGARSASHICFENTPHAGRSSNNNDEDREQDGRIAALKKLPPPRVVKEETPRKEPQKNEFISEGGGNRSGSGGGTSSVKKMKVESSAQKTSLNGPVVVDLKASGGGRLNVENIGITKTTSAKMKDVKCIDGERKGPHNISSSLVSSKLPMGKQQQTPPILRQPSTSRVSRHSKRAVDKRTASNPKKRVRK